MQLAHSLKAAWLFQPPHLKCDIPVYNVRFKMQLVPLQVGAVHVGHLPREVGVDAHLVEPRGEGDVQLC
jgi:hypothetical protein